MEEKAPRPLRDRKYVMLFSLPGLTNSEKMVQPSRKKSNPNKAGDRNQGSSSGMDATIHIVELGHHSMTREPIQASESVST
jgi:hypothetical protein